MKRRELTEWQVWQLRDVMVERGEDDPYMEARKMARRAPEQALQLLREHGAVQRGSQAKDEEGRG